MKEAIQMAGNCGDPPQLSCHASHQHAAAQAVTSITILHVFKSALARWVRTRRKKAPTGGASQGRCFFTKNHLMQSWRSERPSKNCANVLSGKDFMPFDFLRYPEPYPQHVQTNVKPPSS